MPSTQYLRALQALDLVLRHGSIQRAAEDLAITPAAAGQRIRALEDYLGTDLLLRGRSGLRPTSALEGAVPDLRAAFDALSRVSETLDFQRVSELHILADADWAELWLLPRLPSFRAAHANISFCINGEGDVPLRLGAPDLRVSRSDDTRGTTIFHDKLVAITGPDNLWRLGVWDEDLQLEGLPLLHVEYEEEGRKLPGWPEWLSKYGLRREGTDRGMHYRNVRHSLEAVRANVGFLICGLGLARRDLELGIAVLAYPADRHLADAAPYRFFLRQETRSTAQVRRFADWLVDQARETQGWIDNTALAK